MKKVFLPLILGLVLGACSRDNDENLANNGTGNNTKEAPILLTKVVNVEESGDVETITFKYEGDKLVEVKDGYEKGWFSETKFVYTGDLVTSSIEKESNGDETETKYIYTIDQKLEKVVSIAKSKGISTDPNVAPNPYIVTTTKNYRYNGNTVVVQETEDRKYTVTPNINTTIQRVFTYTVDNDLITKKIITEEDGNTITTTFKYDDKNAPFKNVRGMKALIIEFFDAGVINFKHNVISSEGDGKVLKSEYQYNANGYPIKVTESDEDSIETYTFEYNK